MNFYVIATNEEKVGGQKFGNFFKKGISVYGNGGKSRRKFGSKRIVVGSPK